MSFAQEVARLIEDAIERVLQLGIPGSAISGQIPGSVVAPATGSSAGAVTLGGDPPADVGTADAGTASDVSRSDHVHSHGDQPGGTLHAEATASDAGFVPAASGSEGDVLTIVSGAWAPQTPGGGSLPLTTQGDLLTRDAATNVRLPIGAAGDYLRSDGTDPAWSALQETDLPVEAVRYAAAGASAGAVALWTNDNHIGYDSTNLIYDSGNARLRVPLRLRIPEGSAPSTPPSGFADLYVDTNGVPSAKNDAGVVYGMVPTATPATLTGLNIGSATGAGTGELRVAYSNAGAGLNYVRNTNTGSSAYGALWIGNDTDTGMGFFRCSSTNTGYAGANSLNIGTASAHAISLVTSNAVRFVVNGGGQIAMGGAPVSAVTLTVYGQNTVAGTYSFNAKNSAGSNLMYLENNGAAWVNSAWNISDRRAKRGIRALQATDLAGARAVTFRRYTRDMGDIDEIGVIAQEVQAVAPEFVREGIDGVLGVNMIALLSAKVAVLEDEIAALRRVRA